MLGLPDSVIATLFDLDGVLTDTASVHMAAWTETFNNFLADIVDDKGVPPAPFTPDDYLAHVDGRPREDGIKTFLAARHITVDQYSIKKIAADKDAKFLAILEGGGVRAYPDAVAYLHAAREAGLRIAVVTSSRNGEQVLRAVELNDFVTCLVDGNDIVERRLSGKPSPDPFILAAHLVCAAPEESAVFEDAVSGVTAGAAGGFAVVVGIDRTYGLENETIVAHSTEKSAQHSEHARALYEAGATIVVNSLDQLEMTIPKKGAVQ